MNKHKGDGVFPYGGGDTNGASDAGRVDYFCGFSVNDSGGVPTGNYACVGACADTGADACADTGASDTGCTDTRVQAPLNVRTDTFSGGLSDGAGSKSQIEAPHESAREGDAQHFRKSLPPLRGLVLAGGLSSRLGHDKANLKIHSDIGITDLLDRSMRVLRLVVDDIAVVGRKATGYPSIPDLVTRKGPVGGIASALAAFPGEAVLVLSCDLPFMNASTLRKLLQTRAEAPADTLMTAYRQAETGHKEALVAIYEPGAASYFLESLYADKLKVSMVVPEEQQFFIEYGAEDSLPFFNINYPADLEVVKRLIEVVHAED